MESMINVWTVVEHVRVASGAAELAIFTAILYWFFTSSRVADMLEVVSERVGGWCGRDSSGSLRQAVRARRRHNNDVYTKIDVEKTTRATSLYRVKEGPTVPAPQPEVKPQTGLACSRCAPASRESWQDPKADTGAVINVLDIGRQTFANGGVVSRYLCDLAQCCHLKSYDYKDVVPKVVEDEQFQRAIEEKTQEELRKSRKETGGGDGEAKSYETVRKRVEAKAMKVLLDISSALSNTILKLVAWLVHKAVRRVALGGVGAGGGAARVRAANAGLPLVFVPLHRSHFDYILVSFALYLTGIRPPLVAAGDNMRIPFFGWILRACGAFYIRRRVEGSENHGDDIYKSALRAYIIKSLAEHNNIEFFIEGGRTRTGKPQAPKAGILSVIMDAYLDGTIDDALLVPVTLNYERLVDGNFVREQLGMPKQMETFWSALRGIWRTMNTNHGSIRIDFNQPISLKEMVTSFKKYNHLQAPLEKSLTPPNNNLAVELDRKILYNNSHSSLYGGDVSAQHKVMVEAIGRHLVYDATESTPLMCTNVAAYVLLGEARHGVTSQALCTALQRRASQLKARGRVLAYVAEPAPLLAHVCEMLGRGLIRREGSGEKEMIYPQLSISAALELSYYANSVVVHYAPAAILATALESELSIPGADSDVIRHSDLMEAALHLCEVMCQEFILCPPCHRVEETMLEAVDQLVDSGILSKIQQNSGLEEQRWSRRFADTLEMEEERPDPTLAVKYKITRTAEALAERRRLLLTIRPLLEAYAATCRAVTAVADDTTSVAQKTFVKQTLDAMIHDFTQNKMTYGEAVSTDAIRNCMKLLRQWGVVDLKTVNKERKLTILPPYDNEQTLRDVCRNIYKYNMDTPLLKDA